MLKEKWINDFITLGPVVTHEGRQIRPNTVTKIAIGKVFSLDGTDNLKAVVRVSGAKYDFAGYINANEPVAELLAQAKEKDMIVCVRFDKKRKKKADPLASISDLIVDQRTAKENIVNVVSGIYNFSTNEWILTGDAVSNPEEDPANVLTEIKNASYSVDGFFTSSKKVQGNPDEKANHLLSIYTFMSEYNAKKELGLDVKYLKSMAVYMLNAVNKVQMQVYGLEEVNYKDYSHTKARGMLFAFIHANLLTKEIITTRGSFVGYLDRFISESVEIWNWAIAESKK